MVPSVTGREEVSRAQRCLSDPEAQALPPGSSPPNLPTLGSAEAYSGSFRVSPLPPASPSWAGDLAGGRQGIFL